VRVVMPQPQPIIIQLPPQPQPPVADPTEPAAKAAAPSSTDK